MTLLKHLVPAMAEALDYNPKTLSVCSRLLREAHLISKKGRGRAAATMVNSDATNLLLAAMASPGPKYAPVRVQLMREAVFIGGVANHDGIVIDRLPQFPFTKKDGKAVTLGAALDRLFDEITANEELQNDDGDRIEQWSLEVDQRGLFGFMTMFAVGRRIGHMVFSPKRTRWLSEARIDRVRGLLDRWGFGLVAANRFLSGLRSVISLTVGMVHMPVWRTALYSTLSAFVWTSILAIGGFFVGENWSVVRVYLRNYGWFITGAIVLFIGFQLVRRSHKKRRLAAGMEES